MSPYKPLSITNTYVDDDFVKHFDGKIREHELTKNCWCKPQVISYKGYKKTKKDKTK